jgi:type IV secretion system protein VirB5
MQFKEFIFRKKNLFSTKSKRTENPYVKGAEGRKEWNDRYMNMSKSIRNWQIAFFAAITMSLVFALFLAKLATQSKIQPYIVETNNGFPLAVKDAELTSVEDKRVINFSINQFIINTRTILNDTDAEKSLLDKVYAYSANNTINFLHEFYQKYNPFNLASKYTTSINIINSMSISKNTWQVMWEETQRSSNDGQVISTTRWIANLTFKFGEVNPKFTNYNPFGLYITDISWSQNQNQ